jgi:predicted GIY-YIG superfamily endonuclease
MNKSSPTLLSHQQYATRIATLSAHLDGILSAIPVSFKNMRPTKLPRQAAVYIIYTAKGGPTAPYYIGRTKNLQQRLYRNHLMGSLSNARLKKYLIDAQECADLASAKTFIRAHCHARWVLIRDMRERFLAEGFLAATLQPKYGVYEEH